MRYRHFRNADPPALLALWNQSLPNRGAIELRSLEMFDHCAFNKPYFDHAGLIVAEDAEKRQLAGFVHAGFGPNGEQTEIDRHRGVICALMVHPERRRRGIGRELLRRAEDYLHASGASEIVAGSTRPLKPFYTGIYGGSNAAGFLLSDPDAGPFFLANGYAERDRILVLQRPLDGPLNIVDHRFTALRRRYEGQPMPMARLGTWWRECVLGPLDPSEFHITDKQNGQTAARALFWEMKEYGWRWGSPSAGVIDVQVRTDLRRQGLGKFLLSQLLRHLQDQYFGIVECQIPANDDAAFKMFRALGFHQVDTGVSYQLSPKVAE
jgi:ribosomal protein S18 acetylase RimI-like enzyme